MGDQTRVDEFTEYATARQNHLLRTAYLLCSDWHGAQDLTQTALLNLCKAWNRASRADSVDAYAHKTLINAYIRGQRKLRRERELRVEALSGTERLNSATHDPDRPETRLALLSALDRLPARARAVVVLRFWEDLSVEATAAALDCSTGNVKSQSSRALAKLRVLLGEEFSAYGPRSGAEGTALK
ncbi:SigE family RNA polymerase sigma factor [Catenulispora sp. NF23]|uniref:SigE family RNA polymerase sigma factor n=1 Tax=Catenulispora pinistramenti TaxID=2705254 RepID=UPI001BA7E491|nr:SigE family RNA polymerase sigma factor [Catenulispora pinistramenti]MBS2537518.1 SigE family RNA polymerase sigma factor [Catenulispora pinistramenti]